MPDPWTGTTVWGQPEGRGGGSWVEVGKGREMGTSVRVSTTQNKEKEKEKMPPPNHLSEH